MNKESDKKSLLNKITAILVSVCISAAFAPAVFAQSLSDNETASQIAQTTEASHTAQSDESGQNTSNHTSGAGFENVESDGGTMLVGTARIPKSDGGFATVKFIYSSGINLNDKSLSLINTELNACGVTISGSMVYVSRSDLVSDSTLVAETSERQAVFACGSEAAPTVLTAYPAYESAERSFEYLYRGYVYSTSGYTSLNSVFSGRKEITLSEDGKSAYTSIVMAEDYVDKVINGKTVRILMINSELKYCFRAPKLVYIKDDNYNVESASDIVYHYGTTTTNSSNSTQTASQTSETVPPEELIVSSDSEASATSQTTSSTTGSLDTQSTTDTTAVNIWDYLTTASETKITAGASPVVTSATQSTTTSATSAESSTAAPDFTTTSKETTTTSSASQKQSTAPEPTSSKTDSNNGASATLPAPTTQTNKNSAILPNVTVDKFKDSQRGIVNTRRLPLNVRSGPGKNYMVVTVLPKGTYVTVLDTSNQNWYMIKTMGKVVGYCYSGYIRIM